MHMHHMRHVHQTTAAPPRPCPAKEPLWGLYDLTVPVSMATTQFHLFWTTGGSSKHGWPTVKMKVDHQRCQWYRHRFEKSPKNWSDPGLTFPGQRPHKTSVVNVPVVIAIISNVQTLYHPVFACDYVVRMVMRPLTKYEWIVLQLSTSCRSGTPFWSNMGSHVVVFCNHAK